MSRIKFQKLFKFKQFTVDDSKVAMKVGTDGVLLGAWASGGCYILDIGTGSGLIALMMAQRFPEARIVAIDIDSDCCRQAEKNVKLSPFEGRIDVVNTSLQDFTRDYKAAPFDAIVTNPPFFINALESPDAGRRTARNGEVLPLYDLIKCSKRLLTDGGTLSIINPIENEEFLTSEAVLSGFTVRREVLIKTKANKPPRRFMVELYNGYSKAVHPKTEILSDDKGGRTEWYRRITSDFYIR